jgi:helicase
VAGGTAFHHAGIDASRRRLIEEAFRRNRIRLLAATTTLAMGLNLPSRRVVIRDWWRFEAGEGLVPLPVMEVKQMAGRAGRPGLDPFGEAVLIARDRRDERRLFADYINGVVEEATSRLAGEASLRSHLLASIVAGFTPTRPVLEDFLGATFCAHQVGREELVRLSGEIVSFLEREEMAVVSGERLAVTPFGRRSAELYIDPLTAVSLRDALRRAAAPHPLPLLHMLARTPDMMVLQPRKREIDELLSLFHRHRSSLLIPEEERHPTDGVLAEMKTAACLLDWVEETPEDGIVGRFAIGPGDLHTLVQLSDWLLYASGQVAKIFALTAAERAVTRLRTRVLYGVKEELLDLVTLRGVGRVRARSLFDAGFRGTAELKGASAAELARLPAIGERVAAEILAQVEAPSAEGTVKGKGRRRR